MAKILEFKKPVQGGIVTFLPNGQCRVQVDIMLHPREVIPLVSAMGLVNVPMTTLGLLKI